MPHPASAQLHYDVIIIGAGAAGLMCAATAGYQGKRVLLLDHAKQAGKKILISGGGRSNFTNMYTTPENYISQNPHFCKSALNRYTQWDFMALVDKHKIPWHEKTLGQLFCDNSAKDLVRMLLKECELAGAKVQLRTEIFNVTYTNDQYALETSQGDYTSSKLVIATGGLSMPRLGATPFGYRIAEQFGHTIEPVRAGLVPFTLHDQDKEQFAELAGLSLDVVAENTRISFPEAMLFTHRGLSGPAMLQISSYWFPGETFNVNLRPGTDVLTELQNTRKQRPKLGLHGLMQQWFPKRLAFTLCQQNAWANKNLADYSNAEFEQIARTIETWQVKPNGTEGYRTAEVTLGGVNVNEVSSKTMESKLQPELYFIGEVLDVTGWLGGYNFQWAWSSGWVAGKAV
ncbi:aminoacetone oxidase family FAD-binding enzyme [Aliidiomarina taiwanensis]|uniref:Aminoacetone oxidase family FAD-binding enzyme n=1 Tax=Aliidiomarina taiwanensis TaxID=946228 RepID=A0A432WW65_9GAMM|nr:NAD(P)/FAD-dependent oxidoreductase [Aliidiomarina taiwanensis]RUO38014.1 aminoacetone oxidase family FAD-binding enzyme [Aliidiomarina taiwanensis]